MAKKAVRKTSPISTLAIGEETVVHPTTTPIGEETTQIAGETHTTLRFGEEHITTLRYGEEGVIFTTLLLGEEGRGIGPVSDVVAELFPWTDPGGPVEGGLKGGVTAGAALRRKKKS
jgi:hypothetical protein